MPAAAEALLAEAEAFRAWQARRYPGKAPREIGGEWETAYPRMDQACRAFSRVLEEMEPAAASEALLREMDYLLARDNEAEWIAGALTEYPDWFLTLCRYSVRAGDEEARWQLAAYLPDCPGPGREELLLRLVEDPAEYVCRRALLSLPKLCPGQVEKYARLFWERSCYPERLLEYQRMAALTALWEAGSPALPEYLERAMEAGGQYLRQCAEGLKKQGG